MEQQAFCENCGTRLPSGAKFCGSCGAVITTLDSSDRQLPQPVDEAASARQPSSIATKAVPIGIASAILIVLAIGFFAITKQQQQLTRDNAASLISNFGTVSRLKGEMLLNDQGLAKGTRQGMWDRNRGLTPAGMELFSSVDYSSLKLKAPVDLAVSVTGITDAPIAAGVKEAQFIWEYRGAPAKVRRYTVGGGRGAALLRRYDDGWRVEEVQFDSAYKPAAAQSPEEVAQEQTEEADRLAQERAREQREQAEKQRVAALVERSQRATREVRTFQLIGMNPYRNQPWDAKVTVTDVSVVIDSKTEFGRGSETHWYGHVADVVAEPTALVIRRNGAGNRIMRAMILDRIYSQNQAQTNEAVAVIRSELQKWRGQFSEVMDLYGLRN